jgi:hypothetical protein
VCMQITPRGVLRILKHRDTVRRIRRHAGKQQGSPGRCGCAPCPSGPALARGVTARTRCAHFVRSTDATVLPGRFAHSVARPPRSLTHWKARRAPQSLHPLRCLLTAAPLPSARGQRGGETAPVLRRFAPRMARSHGSWELRSHAIRMVRGTPSRAHHERPHRGLSNDPAACAVSLGESPVAFLLFSGFPSVE